MQTFLVHTLREENTSEGNPWHRYQMVAHTEVRTMVRIKLIRYV